VLIWWERIRDRALRRGSDQRAGVGRFRGTPETPCARRQNSRFGAPRVSIVRAGRRSASAIESTVRASTSMTSVAIAISCDRAAARRFRRHMADHEAMRGAAEAAVGDQRDSPPRPRPIRAAVTASISGMPGRTDRAFVADDDDIAGADRTACTAANSRGSPSNTRAGPSWRMRPCARRVSPRSLRAPGAAQDAKPPRAFSGCATDTRLAIALLRRAISSNNARASLAFDGVGGLRSRLPSRSICATERGAAGQVHVDRHVATARLQVGDDRRDRG
jgi:hypothetical protein